MSVSEWEFVETVRDFFAVNRSLRKVFDKLRSGSPAFEELAQIVGDADDSILFRLKERCHALFRSTSSEELTMRREALFDLAVGSLFHESMKLRENLYQQEVYAPKVQKLLEQSGDEARDVFRDFERIQSAGADRAEEALRETETLLEQTRSQLRELLIDLPGEGLMARFLVEHAETVEEVFESASDDLIAEIHGDAASGYRLAAHSYLRSAFYPEATYCLNEALRVSGAAPDLARLIHYSEGMGQFLAGRYAQSIENLGMFCDGAAGSGEAGYLRFAVTALSRIPHLIPDAEQWIAEAGSILERVRPLLDARAAED